MQTRDDLIKQVSDVIDAAIALGVSQAPVGFQQSDIDAAVAAAKADDAKILGDMQGQMQGQIDALNKQLADVSAAKQVEDAVVQGLAAQADKLQSIADQLKAFISPPVEVPAPVVTPSV